MKNGKKMVQLFSIVALFLAVIGISIGFAALSTAMEISGTVRVIPANWSVKFNSAEFSDNDTYATNNNVTPTLTTTTISGYEIVLTRPGDKGTYTVEVENDGDIDAKVSAVTIGTPVYTGTGANAAADETLVQNNVTYTITWQGGGTIGVGDPLDHGDKAYIVITAEYNANATSMPTNPVTITGQTLNVTFEQA